VPWIEDDNEAVAMYLDSPGTFWLRLFDKDDAFGSSIILLVVDGAHRTTVCKKIDISKMRVNWLQPTISVAEMVTRISRLCIRVCAYAVRRQH
jgi:hypothetical protein